MMIKMEENEILIQGERIYLRKIKLSDVNEDYLKWMNNKKVTQFLESRFSEQTLDSIKEYVKKTSDSKGSMLLAIVVKKDEKHIGNIRLTIDSNHKIGEIGIMIGDKDCWGKAYGTEAIKLLIGYAFNTLNLHRLTAYIYAPNLGSINAFKKSGFEEEGTKREVRICNGKYVDEKILGIVNQN